MTPDYTLKAVVYSADGEVVLVVIRGDLEVNEIKLKNAIHCNDLRLSTPAEVATKGIVAGFVSPVGLKNIRVIADDSVTSGINFVGGANKPDAHIQNVNYPRDFKADITADIARARVGDSCSQCGGKLSSTRGIEVGHIFKLGTFLSERLGANYIDADGVTHPIIMGCYGIGIGRLLAAAIEQNHDDKGIVWPVPIAPYHIHLCPLYRENSPVAETAEKLYREMTDGGLEVLFDDRPESPGVKFNDADLLGIPLRVTLSARTLEKNTAEVKWRTEKKAEFLPLEGLTQKLSQMIAEKLNARKA